MAAIFQGSLQALMTEFTIEGFTFSLWHVLLFVVISSIVGYLLGGIFR